MKNLNFRLKSLPNILTIFRLILVPLFIGVFFSKLRFHREIAGLIFGISAITDFFDGYLARKYKSETKVGKLLDPVADKLLAVSSLTLLVISGDIPLWTLEILILREIVLVCGSIFIIRKKDRIISPSIWGKITTLSLLLGIFGLLFKIKVAKYLIYFGIIISIVSGVDYILKGIIVLKNSNGR